MPWRPAGPEDGEEAHESGCWIWTGYTDAEGTPVIRTVTSTTTAARSIYGRYHGPVPKGTPLARLCGTSLCVHPRHHEPSSRRAIAYRMGITKLTPRRLDAARSLKQRGLSNRKIAAMLDVDESLVRGRLREQGVENREKQGPDLE